METNGPFSLTPAHILPGMTENQLEFKSFSHKAKMNYLQKIKIASRREYALYDLDSLSQVTINVSASGPERICFAR